MRRRWEDSTSPELAAAAEAGGVVIVPVGAIEQHGPHLAVATDAVCAEAVAAAAAELADSPVPVVVAPTMQYGYSRDHIGFPGTLTLSARVLEDVLVEIGASVLASGFDRLLYLNGHGGNDRLLYSVVRRVQDAAGRRACVAATTYWKLAADELAARRRSAAGGMGHACELETSLMLHFGPDAVRLDAAVREMPEPYSRHRGDDLLSGGAVVAPDRFVDRSRSGVMGDPLVASAEAGAAFADAIARRLAGFIEEFATWPLTEGVSE